MRIGYMITFLRSGWLRVISVIIQKIRLLMGRRLEKFEGLSAF